MAVGVGQIGQGLWMGGADVERLTKGFLGDLPVGPNFLGHMGLHIPVGEIPALKVSRHLADEIIERCRVRCRIDEHESGPGGHLGFGQRKFTGDDLGKVPTGRHVLQLAASGPRKAVE